jgi:DNA-binding MurR/RpiR family transcriptional regulator
MENPLISLANRIAENAHRFTPSDRLIAEYLLRDYPTSFMQTASELAKELNINVATVSRFFPKIGYRNIKEGLAGLRQDFQFLINSPLDRFRSRDSDQPGRDRILNSVMDLDWSNIQRTFNQIEQDKVDDFINYIVDPSRKVFILGTRKEFSLAYYFFHQIFSFRDNNFLLENNRLISQLSEMQAEDLLVVFDFRRYSRTNQLTSRHARETGAKIIVFADSIMAPAAKHADLIFLTNTEGVSVFDSYTAAVTLINFLFAVIIDTSDAALKTKFEHIEKLYKSFEVFSFQHVPPANKS